MPSDFAFQVLMPAALGTVSFAFIGLGFYAIVRSRPFVVHARWMLLILLLGMSPPLAMQVSSFFDHYSGGGLGLETLTSPLMMIIVVWFMAQQTRGYVIFGTTQESFRDAVLAALLDLNLPFEESMSSIRIPSVPAELNVAVQGWIGTGQLRLRNGGRPGLLGAIVRRMSNHFGSSQVKTNMTSAIVCLILGVFMGVTVLTLMFAA